MRITSLRIALAGLVLLASLSRALADEAFLVIANDSVSATTISVTELKDIFTGKTTYWEGGQSITIIFLPDQTDDALKEVSGMDESQFKTFWQRLAFSGRGKMPRKTTDAAATVLLVASTKGAIALVPVDTDLKGVKKLEIK